MSRPITFQKGGRAMGSQDVFYPTWTEAAERQMDRLALASGNPYPFKQTLKADVERRAFACGRPLIMSSDVTASYHGLRVEGKLP
jgi:hypothetical protein